MSLPVTTPRGIGQHKWSNGIISAIETKQNIIVEKNSKGWVYVIEHSRVNPLYEQLFLINKFEKPDYTTEGRFCFIGKIYKLNGLVHNPKYYDWMSWSNFKTFQYINTNSIKPVYLSIYLMINDNEYSKIYECR